jgi:hypothetical protein
VAVGEAADGGVEADNDSAAVDLVDGAGAALEVGGAYGFIETHAGADAEVLEGPSSLVALGAAAPVVDGVDECG